MKYQIQRATRKKAKARIGISGPSGSGKTYSALLLAFGLLDGKEDPKVGVIDTEQHSAELYAPDFDPLGGYWVIPLEPPFTPQKYIDALRTFEEENFDVVIIDSLSHAWAGTGGLLDQHGKIVDSGINPFTAWREITPQHNTLVEAMLQSPCHIIATLRAKTEYVIQETDGKKTVVKVGMGPVQRDGMEYEFTTFFELSHNHTCKATKDRTGLFDNQVFVITTETGKVIRDYLNTGEDVTAKVIEEVTRGLQEARTVEELKHVWDRYYKDMAKMSRAEVEPLVQLKNKRKQELITSQKIKKEEVSVHNSGLN